VSGTRYGATGRYPDLWLVPGNAGHSPTTRSLTARGAVGVRSLAG
jgi:hypothetical protein